MSGMAATGAALRLRLLFRILRVGELLALVALLSWSSSRAPSAAAAAVRVARSLLFSPRFVFVLGNAIVLLLLALSRRERDTSPVSSASNHHPAGALTPEVPAAGNVSSFAAPETPTPNLISEGPVETAAAPVVVVPAMPMATVFEEEVKPAAPAAARVVVVSKARAPRRSRSEKMSPRGVSGSRRAGSPERLMRRSESDNGRRRRSSASARDVAEWAGTEDAVAFQRKVEAFIARQTRFRREEECMAGALVGSAKYIWNKLVALSGRVPSDSHACARPRAPSASQTLSRRAAVTSTHGLAARGTSPRVYTRHAL